MIPVAEQVEMLSLVGDVAVGQLMGRVRPMLEVTVVESPAHLRREHDPEWASR